MEWSNHPNISAIVWAGLPGQESGNSLADVLFGDVNPSARLPYTIANAESDYHSRIEKNKDIHYTEDLKLGYRWFESQVNMNDVLDSYDMIVSIELLPLLFSLEN
jgi:beta-glucosidase